MGERGQIKIGGIYLYTHWGADDLQKDIAAVLSRNSRWDDPEYLARMLFCRMIDGDLEGETGFGISTEEHGDNKILINVDCSNEKITVYRYGKQIEQSTFSDYAKTA